MHRAAPVPDNVSFAAILDRVRILCTVYDPVSGEYRVNNGLFLDSLYSVLAATKKGQVQRAEEPLPLAKLVEEVNQYMAKALQLRNLKETARLTGEEPSQGATGCCPGEWPEGFRVKLVPTKSRGHGRGFYAASLFVMRR